MNKLLVANEANTYIADVAEFDWSFTGQFAGAGWVEPLDNVLSAKTLADLKNTDAAFVSGGKTYIPLHVDGGARQGRAGTDP